VEIELNFNETTDEDELISTLPLSTHSAVEMLHDSVLCKFMIDIDIDTDIKLWDSLYLVILPHYLIAYAYTQARFPFKRNRLRCVRCVHCVNKNRKKRKRFHATNASTSQ